MRWMNRERLGLIVYALVLFALTVGTLLLAVWYVSVRDAHG